MAAVLDRPVAPSRAGTLFVDVLRWPLDVDQRAHGRALGRACLWLLDVGELAPDLDATEDWVRLPISDADLDARVGALADRVYHGRRLEPGSVRVVDGLLSFGGRRQPIPDTEARILDRLGETPDQVVRREELVALVWGEGGSRAALDSRIHTLRERLRALELCIHTIRGRGFLLAAAEPEPLPSFGTHHHRSTSWLSS